MFDTPFLERIAEQSGVDPVLVQKVLAAVDLDHEYGPLVRNSTAPREKRCKMCRVMRPAAEVADDRVCTTCRPERVPDEREASQSVRGVASGGLPSLGRR